MFDHFKGFAFLVRPLEKFEMKPLWPGLSIWALVLVAVLIFT